MNIRSLVFAILLVAGNGSLAECDCLWQGSFAEVQVGTDLVVSGAVSAGVGNSVDFTVARTLRGQSNTPTIRIWLKTGDYCRPEPELFPTGSNWLMALHRIDKDVPGGFNPNTPNFSYGRIGDYRLSSCGGYWLSENEGVVSGNLVDAPRWVREPQMTPVLLDLVAEYIAGNVDAQALLQASREDPALKELMLDTRAFLRDSD